MNNIIRPQINSDDSSQAAPRWTQIKDVCNKNRNINNSRAISSSLRPQKCDGEGVFLDKTFQTLLLQ